MTPPSIATLSAPACAPAPVQHRVPGPAPLQVQGLSLAEPLPGFPGHRDYVLVPAEDGGRLFWLQSVAPDGPRFLAVPAGAFFPDYSPRPPEAACDELGLGDVADASLYCLVTVPDGDVAAATANLRAPVVVNPATHRARQVVLLDGSHPIRAPLRR
ncbi:flagellar assembly protein FliW [Blastococcus brunescens]|uniref:Flagellar assembly factor FliW n=1 Tax=Blastococcus brunescens TaxID=1564165 RepID=A0ABZ1B4N1_9ACTN|nr:flagellar assembly protein FliW [Blastococcus sp. BMG 8361]WRL64803.1 flagellar assembly protein FliW [Blastococcus sp. BMG 8361]